MKLNRSLFFTTVGLLFAVLLIPLFVNNSLFFPFITGKNFAFRILVELATLSWVILMLRDKSFRLKKTWIFVAITIFVIIVGVADIFSSNPVKSFLSNFERMEGWITMVHLFAYFMVTASVLRTWSYWRRYFQVSVIVSAIVCVHGLMQLAGAAAIHQSTSRLDASFGNATYLAIYMLFHIFITAILLLRRLKERVQETPWYKDWFVYAYGVMIIMQATVLFFTATRGTILGLIGGLIMTAVLIAFTERESKIIRKISVGALILIAVLIGLFFLTKNTSFVQHNEVLSRFSSISLSDNTTKSRFLIWNMAWQGVISSPKHFILGWGQESFNYIFSQYYNPGMYAQEQWFDRSHNVLFDWLTASGMLGLAAYLAIFGVTLYCLWKSAGQSRLEKSLITGLFAGYFFHNLFVFDNITSYIMFFIVLAYVDSTSAAKTEVSEAVIAPIQPDVAIAGDKNLNFQYIGSAVAIVIFIAIFYQYNYKALAANMSLINALTQTQTADGSIIYTSANVESFKKALSYNTIGLYETREQLFEIAAKAASSNSDPTVKQDLINMAKTEVDNQLKDTPNDVRYYVLGGVLYQNLGDYAKASDLLEKAESLSPNKQSLLFALGSNYFAEKEYTKALAVFKKAYEVDTTFDEAKKLYALVALYVGQDKIANDLFGPGPIMDPRFLAAYNETKHYDLMIAYLENKVADTTATPQDQIQSRVALAAGYLTVGSRTKAITTLESIKKLLTDSSALAQLDSLISQVKAGKNPFNTPAAQ